MEVRDLVEFLKTQDQDLPVAYYLRSEAVLLELNEIVVQWAGLPRNDGWVANKRPDKPIQQYLMFPGN